jgi:FkbM family methyltransferase
MRVTRLHSALTHLARTIAGRQYFRGRDRLALLLLWIQQRTFRVETAGIALDLNCRDGASRSVILAGNLPGHTWRVISALLRSDDVFVDVGANIGYTTLVGAQQVGPGGRVIAFEPSPRAFGSLQQNVRINRFVNVIAEQAACGEFTGEAAFHVSDASDEYNSFKADTYGMTNRVLRVPVVRLDDSLARHTLSRIRLVKIDVEGAEHQVLAGMQETLQRCPPEILCIEASARNMAAYGKRPSDLFADLGSIGYSLVVLTTRGTIRPYASEYVDQADILCDVICFRAEAHDDIQALSQLHMEVTSAP